MEDNLYSQRIQNRHNIEVNRKRAPDMDSDDLSRQYRSYQPMSSYRMDAGHDMSNSQAVVPHNSTAHPPPNSIPMSDTTPPPPKKSKFMFIGDFFDCNDAMEAFVRAQDNNRIHPSEIQPTNFRTPNRVSNQNNHQNESSQDEIASLIYENNDLNSKLKKITKDYQLLRAENARLKHECETLRGQGYSQMADPTIDDAHVYTAVTNGALETLTSQQTEMLNLLRQIKSKVDVETQLITVPATMSTSYSDWEAAAPSGEDDDTILLPPGNLLKCNRGRFSHARASSSPSAFVQKLVTAIFSFDELIGATLAGYSYNEKRKKDENDPAEAGKGKSARVPSVNNTKVDQLCESAIHFFPNASRSELRKSIGWKISKINSGQCTKMDKFFWEGFRQSAFEALAQKNNHKTEE